MTQDSDVRITHWRGTSVESEEIRLTVNGGGPSGTEFIIDTNSNSTKLSVWNPWRNEWATVTLEGPPPPPAPPSDEVPTDGNEA